MVRNTNYHIHAGKKVSTWICEGHEDLTSGIHFMYLLKILVQINRGYGNVMFAHLPWAQEGPKWWRGITNEIFWPLRCLPGAVLGGLWVFGNPWPQISICSNKLAVSAVIIPQVTCDLLLCSTGSGNISQVRLDSSGGLLGVADVLTSRTWLYFVQNTNPLYTPSIMVTCLFSSYLLEALVCSQPTKSCGVIRVDKLRKLGEAVALEHIMWWGTPRSHFTTAKDTSQNNFRALRRQKIVMTELVAIEA
jgi:hypothetical protein